LVYAFRRTALYPDPDTGTELPDEGRAAYLRAVREVGFEGLELGVPPGNEADLQELRRELEDNGLPCRAVRGGGPSLRPGHGEQTQSGMERALRAAVALGAPVFNASISMPRPSTARSEIPWGEATSWGSSRDAVEADFDRAAAALGAVAPMAADLGVTIAVEIHQHCLVDNSWSGRVLVERAGHPAVGLNPDLGNVYWAYNVPEETSEQAIVAMAPLARYWHMKNLKRVYVPQHEHAIFLQVPLPDGDIDYCFAVRAMLAAGYQGDFAIEGLRLGDQLRGDCRSLAYVRELLNESVE
jgi:sugar phosphate isomerase/epimerase